MPPVRSKKLRKIKNMKAILGAHAPLSPTPGFTYGGDRLPEASSWPHICSLDLRKIVLCCIALCYIASCCITLGTKHSHVLVNTKFPFLKNKY